MDVRNLTQQIQICEICLDALARRHRPERRPPDAPRSNTNPDRARARLLSNMWPYVRYRRIG